MKKLSIKNSYEYEPRVKTVQDLIDDSDRDNEICTSSTHLSQILARLIDHLNIPARKVYEIVYGYPPYETKVHYVKGEKK